MPVESLFATEVYRARIRHRGIAALNADLLRECRQLRIDDAAGRRWSRAHYPGGFTSYGSVNRLHGLSPTFARLRDLITPHVKAFVGALHLDLAGRPLEMTDCWVNIMSRGIAHGWHLHPLSTISGTYYVQTPPGCAGIKFEDPRLDRMMAAPPRRVRVPRSARVWVSYPAQAGHLVLFESWLRHEVPVNPVRAERVSVSFNYGWF
ncbi:MAG: hypothetical protein KGL36_09640 [Gammaproteobacteria bacterium]|nr:hypothetical protein [Gammaproteobacteria bacterium]